MILLNTFAYRILLTRHESGAREIRRGSPPDFQSGMNVRLIRPFRGECLSEIQIVRTNKKDS